MPACLILFDGPAELGETLNRGPLDRSSDVPILQDGSELAREHTQQRIALSGLRQCQPRLPAAIQMSILLWRSKSG